MVQSAAQIVVITAMEIDTIHKFALAGATILGVVVTATKAAFDKKTAGRHHLKAELELLQALENHVSQDASYRDFIADARKEKLSSLIFGYPIRNDELGRLMEYYRRGNATLQEIGLAWPYRTSNPTRLDFVLSVPQRLFLLFVQVYGIGCAVAGGFCWFLILAMPRELWMHQLELAAYSLVFLLLSAFWYRSHRGLVIARRLSRR